MVLGSDFLHGGWSALTNGILEHMWCCVQCLHSPGIPAHIVIAVYEYGDHLIWPCMKMHTHKSGNWKYINFAHRRIRATGYCIFWLWKIYHFDVPIIKMAYKWMGAAGYSFWYVCQDRAELWRVFEINSRLNRMSVHQMKMEIAMGGFLWCSSIISLQNKSHICIRENLHFPPVSGTRLNFIH